MADSKISQLPDGVTIASGDLLVIARAGADYKLAPPSLDQLIAVHPVGADLDLNGHKVKNAATPTLPTDLTTKAYVDSLLSGGPTTPNLASVLASGNDAGATSIANLGAPVAETDAATKGYVDTMTFNNIPATQTAYTLLLTDLGDTIDFTSNSACALTIPANVNVAFPIGALVYVRQGGGGAVTVVGATGVSIANPYSLYATTGQNSELRLLKIGTDAWSLNGEVT